jgi:hypothetical protein
MNINNIYTIVDFPVKNKTYGNYSGNKPNQAAEKAFIDLLNHVGESFKNNSEGKFIVFIIRDMQTTIEYKYIGTVIKLNKPKGDYLYKNVITKYNPKLDKLYNL